ARAACGLGRPAALLPRHLPADHDRGGAGDQARRLRGSRMGRALGHRLRRAIPGRPGGGAGRPRAVGAPADRVHGAGGPAGAAARAARHERPHQLRPAAGAAGGDHRRGVRRRGAAGLPGGGSPGHRRRARLPGGRRGRRAGCAVRDSPAARPAARAVQPARHPALPARGAGQGMGQRDHAEPGPQPGLRRLRRAAGRAGGAERCQGHRAASSRPGPAEAGRDRLRRPAARLGRAQPERRQERAGTGPRRMRRMPDAPSAAAAPRPEPFVPQTAPEVLEDLRARLRATRWPDAPEDAGWSLGTDLAHLRELVAYWADGFDWPAQEAALGRLPRFRVALGGLTIHFVHARAAAPAGAEAAGNVLPLVLCHGWPDSFWRYTKVIPLLTDPGAHDADPADAFDVVVPDMPGYGYSSRPAGPALDSIAVADLWARLMSALGYERFGAAGGDIG